jgi:hypothetical protein
MPDAEGQGLIEEDELNSLIIREIEAHNREIEAHNFFVDCDSANAHASRCVQRELTFIRSLANLATREERIGR